MLNILVFNAGHEESLSYHDTIYRTPKKEICNIRLSLWSLMRFVAKDEDLILSGNYIFGEILIFNKNGEIINVDRLPKKVFLTFWAIEPSLINYLAKLFHEKGIEIETYGYSDFYAISHRKMSKELSDYVTKHNNSVESILKPEWIDNTNKKTSFNIFSKNVERILRNNDNNQIVIKKAYTSSGRGVLFFRISDLKKDTENVFNKMVNIEEFSVEPYFKPMDDWAAEFFIDDNGKCKFVALSNFYQKNGKYIGNFLDSQEALWDKLSNQIKQKYDLEEIIKIQSDFLESKIKGKYIGFVGIDMFTYINSNNEICLNPFVEINLRMTMGLIAHYIYETNKQKYKSRMFTVEPKCSLQKQQLEEIDMWTENNIFRVFIK